MCDPPMSPLYSVCHSLKEEKVEMQNLNHRLACYIDRIHFLESENARLWNEANMHTNEKMNIKSTFECELEDVRKSLNDRMAEKSQMEIEIKQLCDENGRLRNTLHQLSGELDANKAYEEYYNSTMYDKQCYLDRIRELEELYNEQRCLRAENESEIRMLKNDIAQQMQDYQCLMDVKISLDLEIAEYGKLLAAEDERLNRFLSYDCNQTPCDQNCKTI